VSRGDEMVVGATGNLNLIVSIDEWTQFASFVLARESTTQKVGCKFALDLMVFLRLGVACRST
jgi:hypothetical protein